MNTVERLEQTQQAIARAVATVGRAPGSVHLLAVSKKQSVEAIRAAYAAGQRAFGENYLQEALQKQAELSDLAIDWHFIGAIQSRKCTAIARHFDWVHTVSRHKELQRLDVARAAINRPLNVCVQVNVDSEESKNGIYINGLRDFFSNLHDLIFVRIRGLMCIPKPESSGGDSEHSFKQIQAILHKLQENHVGLDTLSMGMSADFAQAIACGSTIVRVGTGIFGPRPAK